jgi:hypothetical protein
VPVSDTERQRSVDFVVKALSAATTRGGSAWQASKDVLPTGARASKQRAGSVDGVGRKAGSRGSKARITDRRTEADEAKILVQPSTILVTRITWVECERHHCQPMTRNPRFDSPEAGERAGLRVARESAALEPP